MVHLGFESLLHSGFLPGASTERVDWGGVAGVCTLWGSLLDWGFSSAYTQGQEAEQAELGGSGGHSGKRGGGRWTQKELGGVSESGVEVGPSGGGG